MPSKNRITGYLKEEDYELFQQAVVAYGLGESELIREILHSWLFKNKLLIEGKRNAKRKI